MPSHQDRREPLPPDYQYGDAAPKTARLVTLTKPAFRILHRMIEKERYYSFRYFTVDPKPYPVKICIGDMTFIEEK
jgi:hypothetical protein